MAYGILTKIPKSAYDKALKKVQKERKSYRGKKSKPLYKQTYATNRDRAVVEIYKFQNRTSAKPFTAYLKDRKITNWTGLRMCDVTSRSSARTGGFARGSRVTVTARCIDGHTYVGRGPGDGMYINMKPKRGR